MENNNLEDIHEQFNRIKNQFGGFDGFNNDIFDEKFIEELMGDTIKNIQNELIDESIKFDLKVQKLTSEAVFPKYAYQKDSGFDLYSTEDISIPSFGRALVPTGLKFKIPENCELQVRPKSGLAINKGLTVLNTPGTVDNGYTGEVKVIIFNTNNFEVSIEKGTKIGQAVLCPVIYGELINLIEVDDVESSERGENGFGSTGLK